MPTTDNHGWPTPAEGEEDYEETFSNFFTKVDTAVEIRDTDANTSNYDPKQGAKYVATDTTKVYIGDGNNWNHVVTTGKNPTYDSVGVGDATAGIDTLSSISDDGTATLDISNSVGNNNLLYVTTPDSDKVASLFVAATDTLNSAATGPNVTNAGNTTLSGTTSTDGTLNLAVSGTTLYVENRLGSNADVRIVSIV